MCAGVHVCPAHLFLYTTLLTAKMAEMTAIRTTTPAPAHTRISTSLSRWETHRAAVIKPKSKRKRLKGRDKSAHRCVEVCDRRQGPGRWSGAGVHTAGPDDGLHRQLRTEPPLTPVAGDLPVPADAVRSV